MNSSWLKVKDFNLRPRSNSVKTFKSYVDLDDGSKGDEQGKGVGDQIEPLPDIKDDGHELEVVPFPSPTILPGELIVAEAENVLKFNPLSNLNTGISGNLICTNFKLSFLTAETFPSNLHQRNLLLADNDICLINIDSIFHVTGGKKKKILSSNFSGNIEILEVHCKDFRIYTFSFKFSPANQRAVISAILHHAFTRRLHLLFAFDYAEPSSYEGSSTFHSLNFTRPSDWEAELQRCHCPGWRVSQVNEKYLLCDNLPECFVVPYVLLDMNLNKAAPNFAGHRVPTWSWGVSSGASIVRMAATDPSISDSRQQELMIEAISRAIHKGHNIKVVNADDLCPNIKDIQTSFLKLKDLCMPATAEEFWETDSTYYSRLESTKWLQYVSTFLSIALESALALKEGDTTIVFIENEGRDANCLLSSLVQLLLDPLYHKQSGFQYLVQKEWIAMGHPFTERLRHISGSESEESPVFLLFLDCVWQLMQQCPTVFDFSETYLTTLWDSCHISLFDTFLFSSTKARNEARFARIPNNKFQLRSVWNWTKLFGRNDIKLFQNPLYILNKFKEDAMYNRSPNSCRPRSFNSVKETRESQRRPLKVVQQDIKPVIWSDEEENLLKIDPTIKSLSLWRQCYLRWIPLAHVLGGGPPVLFLNNIKAADEIKLLEKSMQSMLTKSKTARPPSLHRRAASDDYTISADIIDIGHIQEGACVVTSAFPFSPIAPWDWQSFQFVPSSSCLQISYTSDDDLDD